MSNNVRASPTDSQSSFRLKFGITGRFFPIKLMSPLEKKAQQPDLNILADNSIESFVSYLKDNKCREIVVMTGAGISTSAGIPERVAGIEDSYIVEAHGSFASAKCVGKLRDPILLENSVDSDSDDSFDLEKVEYRACGKEYSQDWVKQRVFDNQIPECTVCEGIVKPNITFFGEALPNRFHAMASRDFISADALIVIGTSLKVQPFASLINKVRQKIPRLLINMETVGIENSPHRGFDFTGETQEYRRDARFIGTADAGCEKLAEMLGLGEKLRILVDEEHSKIDVSNNARNQDTSDLKITVRDVADDDELGVSLASLKL
ncbi:NAD-dependent protein deacetylase sirtuin-2 [Physocladia obscura]|uniref:NAD-dependent protein deacetylase sirtuin-2 n=1 Tax=Physocladia obscura TaxID=109957 RepID=A0AAD5XJB2_9FUNG|nr:NAD-dependent protein deacetylase sirtuin-2 [Physocladia obscura]